MSLCFRAAFLATLPGNLVRINQDEYLDHILAHFRGVRHPEDASERDFVVSMQDEFGASVRKMAVKNDYRPLSDTSSYHELFSACFRDNLGEVKSTFDRLEEQQTLTIPLQPLATLSASKGFDDVFKFCIHKGAVFDEDVDRAVKRGIRNVAMLDTLFASNWRDMRHSPMLIDELIANPSVVSRSDTSMLDWLLGHGGRVTPDAVANAALSNAPVSTMSVLLQNCEVSRLHGTGVLRTAADGGNVELVRLLLDSGLDINEESSCGDIREMPSSALFDAVTRDRIEVVKLLLDRGARIQSRGYSYDVSRTESAAEKAKRKGGAMAALFETRVFESS